MSERRVFLNLWAAYDAGDKRHAQVIMRELAEKHGFGIIEAIPQSIADGWEFRLDVDGDVPWPSFVREGNYILDAPNWYSYDDGEPGTLRRALASAYVGRRLPDWAMIVSCYLDDSRGGRRSAIAGYLAPLDVWDRIFNPVWQRFLDNGPRGRVAEFKASNCSNRFGEFSDWTKDEAAEFGKRAIQTLGNADYFKHVYGVGAAMIIPRVEEGGNGEMWERWGYQACFVALLMNVVYFLKSWYPPIEELQVIHDDQPAGIRGMIMNAYDEAHAYVSPSCPFKISRPLNFKVSKDVLPLQAADILAYETRKDVVNRLSTPQRARSRGLIHLIENLTHIGFYVDGVALQEARDHALSPPILYESRDARQLMPWADRSRILSPPPLMP
jgi:hypothetical protein